MAGEKTLESLQVELNEYVSQQTTAFNKLLELAPFVADKEARIAQRIAQLTSTRDDRLKKKSEISGRLKTLSSSTTIPEMEPGEKEALEAELDQCHKDVENIKKMIDDEQLILVKPKEQLQALKNTVAQKLSDTFFFELQTAFENEGADTANTKKRDILKIINTLLKPHELEATPKVGAPVQFQDEKGIIRTTEVKKINLQAMVRNNIRHAQNVQKEELVFNNSKNAEHLIHCAMHTSSKGLKTEDYSMLTKLRLQQEKTGKRPFNTLLMKIIAKSTMQSSKIKESLAYAVAGMRADSRVSYVCSMFGIKTPTQAKTKELRKWVKQYRVPEAAEEIARNSLLAGIDENTVSKITGINIATIKKIKALLH